MLRIKGFAFENLFDIFEKRYKKPVSKGKLFFDHARFHKCTQILYYYLLPCQLQKIPSNCSFIDDLAFLGNEIL